MLKHQYNDDVTSVRGVEPTKPAWTVRYEDHKPPGHNWFHPHVIRIHRYVHEKTARNRFEEETRRTMHPRLRHRHHAVGPERKRDRHIHKAAHQAVVRSVPGALAAGATITRDEATVMTETNAAKFQGLRAMSDLGFEELPPGRYDGVVEKIRYNFRTTTQIVITYKT